MKLATLFVVVSVAFASPFPSNEPHNKHRSADMTLEDVNDMNNLMLASRKSAPSGLTPWQDGKSYRSPFGWVVRAGAFLCATIDGSNGILPRDETAVNNLAADLTESVLHAPANAGITSFGTWSWSGTHANNWKYADIPYSIMKKVAIDAIKTATSVVRGENYVFWEIYDSTNQNLLYTFKLFPRPNPPGEGWALRDVEAL